MKGINYVAVAAGLFAFASVATALRFGDLPVGVGELCGIVLILVALLRWRALGYVTHPILLFWFGYLLAVGVGFLVGSVQGGHVGHTVIAYAYKACFALMVLAFLHRLGKADLNRIVVATCVIAMVLLLVPFYSFLSGPNAFAEWLGVNFQFPSRLSGWSSNPNQLAFFMLTLPIWLAAALEEGNWSGWRWAAKSLFLLVLFVLGLSIRSDALFLAWVLGLALLTVAVVLAGKANWRMLGTMAAAFIVAFCLFKSATEGVGCVDLRTGDPAGVASVEPGRRDGGWCFAAVVAFSPAKGNSLFGVGFGEDKGEVRARLWRHALDVWQQSPVFGHGPGAFSYRSDPNVKEEAHNLYLDMLTQGGIVAVALFSWLYAWLGWQAWKARDPYAATVLVVLMLFCGAHFMLRQPVLTLNLALCAVVTRHGFFGRYRGERNQAEAV
ncbi:MAG: O-antigen ligase family protein [Alphaproteobacteria bacterium]|nr:O-antigen ligase family protein [Alphaproteobacteria bacterium]